MFPFYTLSRFEHRLQVLGSDWGHGCGITETRLSSKFYSIAIRSFQIGVMNTTRYELNIAMRERAIVQGNAALIDFLIDRLVR